MGDKLECPNCGRDITKYTLLYSHLMGTTDPMLCPHCKKKLKINVKVSLIGEE